MQSWHKTIITRKSHQCWGCGDVFPEKTSMVYSTNIDGGQFCHAYWCEICEEIMGGLDDWEREDGFNCGDIKQNYPDEYKEVSAVK